MPDVKRSDATETTIKFFIENEHGYAFMCELLNSSLDVDAIEEAVKGFFNGNFQASTGHHVSSRFVWFAMQEFLKQVDWKQVISFCVGLNE